MIAVCLGVVGYQNKLKADVKLPEVTRGVIDQLEQIPETKRTMYDNDASTYKKGTKENPFFILEIVPYEEYGVFGYQIGGCEPLDVERMCSQNHNYMNTISSFNTCSVESQGEAYFFQEELERMGVSLPSKANTWGKVQHQGYYELVDNGKGDFKQNEDGTIVKEKGGNIIWHTIASLEMEYEYSTQNFQDKDETKKILQKKGERIYTIRERSDSDPVYSLYDYKYYHNNENFLIKSMCLSEKEAKEYSVIIKTITPKELNANPNWAKYADLYVVTPVTSIGGYGGYPSLTGWEGYKKVWAENNWYGHTAKSENSNGSFENTDDDKDKDITWDVVKIMYEKVTAQENYAAIMMSADTYDGVKDEKTVTAQILDWNLNSIGEYSDTACNNNMYKLAVMLLSMNPDLFKKLYWNTHLIDDTGKFLKQTGEAQEYWTLFTFLPCEDTWKNKSNWYEYWTKPDKWEDYQMGGNINANHSYTNNRVFICGEGGDNLRNYLVHGVSTSIKKDGTDEVIREYTDFKKYVNDADSATPAEAVGFILGIKNSNDKIKGDLNILDIEPCFDIENGYTLTENYIYLMMPNFDGNVNITHMTTAEFIGKSEDLNSTYNMIFMGLDDGGYNKDWSGKTVWNDTAMNGKIYFHTGDLSRGGYWPDNKQSVKFLYTTDTSSSQYKDDRPLMRFPGNDITELKKTELEKFLKAGYPIVATPYLYKTDALRIDQYSNICKLIKEQKKNDATLYATDDASAIETAVKRTMADITWQKLPNIYNGETTGENESGIKDPNYLEINDNGRSLLPFKFQVNDEDSSHKYKYRIYIDQNQDGKFEDEELYYEGKAFHASDGVQQRTLKISKMYIGFIQWKIEVYRTDNEQIRFMQTGCSAAKNRSGEKIKIKVLQIMPNSRNLDLSVSSLFKKYYTDLDDYEISVDAMTVTDFQNKLKRCQENGTKFKFDYSVEVTETNPSNYSQKLKSEIYDKYNMIIVGFGDCYGYENITNENGAVDFLKYFVAQGKSILFTHDVTSMNNIKENNSIPFGYSANTLMRDLMGMNRYKAVHKDLTESEREELQRYQKKNQYDTVTDVNGNELDEKHGWTYYAMKRVSVGNSEHTWKMPYQAFSSRGFDDYNDLTLTVTKTNDGQITQYPYKIGSWIQDNETGKTVFDDSKLKISRTHGQWYQLDMEDPEVTVWYCLADDKSEAMKQVQQSEGWSGDPMTYGVSPNDAANNYYIYSKGNVFYSGVGHSSLDLYKTEMEAKLFINTIIGAYSATYEAPMVEILNPEAELIDAKNMTYTMRYNQEYDDAANADRASVQESSGGSADSLSEGDGDDSDSEMVKIKFSPVELNIVRTKLSMSIYYPESGSAVKHYVTTIYHMKEDGTAEKLTTSEAADWVFSDSIKSMDEYYFYYPKAYLTDANARRNITFEIKNDKVKDTGYTKLEMQTQALFLLD